MLPVRKLRDLSLRAPSAPGRPPFLSAASSLVATQSCLYVIADDELHLGVFPVRGNAKGRLIRLVEGQLPAGPKERKRQKPDFEAQVRLPSFAGHAHGALLSLGSGSKPNRRSAVLLSLGAAGVVVGEPRILDLTGLLAGIGNALGPLNIEGAFVLDDRLWLLQRGNKRGASNALVTLDLKTVLEVLAVDIEIGELPFSVQPVELGAIGGVAWGFTDAAALPDGSIVFTAVAEATDDAYRDGPCAGAALGVLDRFGRLQRFDEIEPMIKVEGVHAERIGNSVRVLLVTDADDVAVPAGLWAAEFS